jgi:hypothetical protein
MTGSVDVFAILTPPGTKWVQSHSTSDTIPSVNSVMDHSPSFLYKVHLTGLLLWIRRCFLHFIFIYKMNF